MTAAVAGRVANLQRLIDAGGRIFLIPRFPPLGIVPRFRSGHPYINDALALEYDQTLDPKLEELKQRTPSRSSGPDMFQFAYQIVAFPQAYGFTNMTDPVQTSPGGRRWILLVG